MKQNFHFKVATAPCAPSHSVLLAALLGDIHCRHVRRFLATVLAEPEMDALLFTPEARLPQTLLIQQLQRAARTSTAWCALGRAQSDVLYAATVLQGLHLRLHRFVYGKADVADVLFTLVHPALRQLDDDAPLTARWLRELMGWGNWDESDPDYLQQMKHALQRTLQRVMGQGAGLPNSMAQMPTDLSTSLAVQRGH